MANDVEKEKRVGEGSWLECFIGYEGGHKTAYRTMLGMTLQMFQQLTGANYFVSGKTGGERSFCLSLRCAFPAISLVLLRSYHLRQCWNSRFIYHASDFGCAL
jgi:hypothetical protein